MRHYAKAVALADFADPELGPLIEEIDPTLNDREPHRKGWEFAMTGLFLREHGHLTPESSVLDVGAGTEALLFWLARHCGRVVGVDIYGEGAFAYREADAGILGDAERFAPYDYPRERLELRHMDARDLQFEDESFDAVVSMSSIEHFGGPPGIREAAAEIGRVLKPGGHALLAIDTFLRVAPIHRTPVAVGARIATLGRRASGATLQQRLVEGLTVAELQKLVIGPSGLELMQPLEVHGDPAGIDNRHKLQPDGTAVPVTGKPFPHLVVEIDGSLVTSVCLPLRRPTT